MPDVLELPVDALQVVAEEAPVVLGEGDLVLETPPVVDDVPLLEGFEATLLEDRPRRRGGAPAAKEEARSGFVYTSCPACGAAQGEPPPAFCEACGQRLKVKAKGGGHDEGVRCKECGLRNGTGSSSCTNCGTRL